jgi:integrase/recombinase XerD
MDPTARLVADYLQRRDPHPGLGADTDPLFHGPNHSRLTRSGLAKLLARHVRAVRARDLGLAPGLPVTPHTLRRTRSMHLIRAGVNLIYIRDLLGHADVSTTEIYAPRRRRGQTRSDRKRPPAAHSRRPARLDPGHLPDRLAPLLGPLTPTAQDYADSTTASTVLTSRNTRAGHITPPSA